MSVTSFIAAPRRAPSRACVALAGLVLAALAGVASATEVPGFDREVALSAREEAVGRFIEELLAQVNVPVRVDDAVRGTVNGEFEGPASRIFEDIAGSFQLTMYYDGAVAWVYPANAIVRDLMQLPGSKGERVMRSAEALDLTDSRNRLEMTDVGLVVTGTSRFVDQVRDLAAAVENGAGAPAAPSAGAAIPGADATMRVFGLRYAWAGDVSIVVGDEEVIVPGVASLLRELVGPGALRAPREVRTRLGTESLEGLVEGDRRELEALGSGDLSPPTTAALPAGPDDGFVGGGTRDTRIVADTLSNSVVVRDRADRMEEYARLIAALDVEPEMIEIEATIIDLNTDRLAELGVDWRVQGDDVAARIGDFVPGDDALAPGPDSLGGDGAGGIVSLVLGDSTRFLTRIRALEDQGAARVVSKPHVMTLSNVEALLNTSSTFFVRVASREDVDLFNVSVGTTLRVTPHVFEGPSGTRIKLRVNVQDGSTTDRSVDDIPVVERSTINTQALMDEGESLLIGGLVREFDGNGVSKVPLLGDIPVLGVLFRNTSQATSRLERMFLITPRVNLRSRDGLRYDAPATSGDEADVIRSAPRRTERAMAAVASRDDEWSLVDELAPNGPDVRLVPPGQARVEELARPAARPERPSLRERLGLERRPDDEPLAPARPGTVAPEPDAPWVPIEEDGWQEVAVPVAAPAPSPDTGVGADVALDDAAALERDGWQVVR